MSRSTAPARSVTSYERPAALDERIRGILKAYPRLLIGRALLFTESMRATEGLPLPLRWARAMVCVLRSLPIDVQGGERIVGGFGSGRYGIFYPELDGMVLEHKTASDIPEFLSPDDLKVIQSDILPYWRSRTYQEAVYAHVPDALRRLLYRNGDMSRPTFIVQETGTMRHSLQWVPDYRKVLTGGFRSIAEEARQGLGRASSPDQEAFFQGILELCDGIRHFAGRYARLAEERALNASNEAEREELLAVAARCRTVPWNPAEHFIDALQAQWFTQLVARLEAECSGNVSNGRMDQYLLPFYRKDVAQGRLTRDAALACLDELWCKALQIVRLKLSPAGAKIYEDYAHWEFVTVGGRNADGSDSTNELSFLLLESATEFPLEDYPYLGVRLHEGTDPDFLLAMCRATQRTGTSPILLNDRTVIERERRGGATLEEACDYCGSGYSEARLVNRDSYMVGSSWMNLPAVLEMAMNDGYCTHCPGYRLGLATGAAETIASFDHLFALFVMQLMHLQDGVLQMHRIMESHRPAHIATPLLSCLHDLCMRYGMDLSSGSIPGANCTGGFLGIVGFATVVDSLAAIKTLVFDEGVLTLKELIGILADNFAGHEDIRSRCLNGPKYGDRVAWVDELAKRIDMLLLTRAHGEVNQFGGRAEIFYVPVKAYIAMGRFFGATPDGRFAGQSFSCGVAPTGIVGQYGPTVALASEAAAQNGELASLGARDMFIHLLPGQICGSVGIQNLLDILGVWCREEHWFLKIDELSDTELAVLRNSRTEYNMLYTNVSGLNAQGYAFSSEAFSHGCPVKGR